MSNDFPIRDITRQMADPARHQVKDDTFKRKKLAVECRDRGNRVCIDMGDEARLGMFN